MYPPNKIQLMSLLGIRRFLWTWCLLSHLLFWLLSRTSVNVSLPVPRGRSLPAQLPHVYHPTAPILLACGAETLPWTPAASPWLTFLFQLLAKAAEHPEMLFWRCPFLLPCTPSLLLKLIKSNLIVPTCRALDALFLPCQLMSATGLLVPPPEPLVLAWTFCFILA